MGEVAVEACDLGLRCGGGEEVGEAVERDDGWDGAGLEEEGGEDLDFSGRHGEVGLRPL